MAKQNQPTKQTLTSKDVKLSNLPILPNPKVNNGIPKVYLFDVQVYDNEVEATNSKGEAKYSIFNNTKRPYLAIYYKGSGNEKGEDRDHVYIQRLFPGDNTKSDGTALTLKEQDDYLQNMIEHLAHICSTFETGLPNSRPLQIDYDKEGLLSNTADVRVAAYNEFFGNIVAYMNGDGTNTKPIYLLGETNNIPAYVPLYLKLIYDKRGILGTPYYVGKGYIERVRVSGKGELPPQISVDLRTETILPPSTKAPEKDPLSESDTHAKIQNALGLGGSGLKF